MQLPKVLLVILLTLIVCSCVNLANKTSKLSVGMTKEQVVAILGQPASTSGQNGAEILRYTLSETTRQEPPYGFGVPTPYYVRLINGRLESYGRMGDFDSTRNPTIRIETDENVKQDVTVKSSGNSDMYTELRKLKDLKDSGILTEHEFEQQKKRLMEKY